MRSRQFSGATVHRLVKTHKNRAQGKARLLPSIAVIAILLAPAFWGFCIVNVGASVIYKCDRNSLEAQIVFSDKPIKGMNCLKKVINDGQDTSSKARTAAPMEPRVADTIPPPATTQASQLGNGNGVVDFGEPNGSRIRMLITSRKGLHYVQLGDSHTAGDFLTGELRIQLQKLTGDGGIGWVSPMRTPGQRLARVKFDSTGWNLVNSRASGPADYPLGGFIASPMPGARLTIAPSQPEPKQEATVLIRQSPGDEPLTVSDADGHVFALQSRSSDSKWQSTTFQARLPLTVVAGNSPGTSIGGWWFNTIGNGAQVSAIGINGSEQSQWSRWRPDWLDDLAAAQPDIIAIAYGTNESLRQPFDAAFVQQSLDTGIARIRQRFPNAAVLVIGPPESLTGKAGICGTRTPELDRVQAIFRQSAQKGRTLYWDWQQAMGGRCSMKKWINAGLGRPDGVHYSAPGYIRIGDLLFDDLIGMARRN